MEKDIERIIAAKLSGHITEEDEKLLNQWLDESNINHLAYQRLAKYWKKSVPEAEYIKSSEIKDQLWNKTSNNSHKKFDISYFVRIAAILLIFISAIFMIFRMKNETPEVAEVNPKYTIKSNPAGIKTITELPDGTKVHLNSESELRFPAQFTDSVRIVQLKGEAFFEVTDEINRPFIVKTGDISTHVLGTAFNIRAFPNENDIEVALESGNLLVERISNLDLNEDEYLLSPGQFINFNHNQIKRGNFDRDKILGWKNGIIIFEKASFNLVIKKLSRWYGVEFVYSGQKPDWSFNGRVDNENLSNILEILSHSQKFNYAIEDKRVKLMF